MVKGILINTDGTLETFEQAEGERLLQGMYRALSVQLVECVQVAEGVSLWLDEEGLYTGQEPNNPATDVARSFGFRNPWGVPLMGPVLVLGGVDDEGDTLSLSPEDEALVRAYALMALPRVR